MALRNHTSKSLNRPLARGPIHDYQNLLFSVAQGLRRPFPRISPSTTRNTHITCTLATCTVNRYYTLGDTAAAAFFRAYFLRQTCSLQARRADAEQSIARS